jgi:hypothetical protein
MSGNDGEWVAHQKSNAHTIGYVTCEILQRGNHCMRLCNLKFRGARRGSFASGKKAKMNALRAFIFSAHRSLDLRAGGTHDVAPALVLACHEGFEIVRRTADRLTATIEQRLLQLWIGARYTRGFGGSSWCLTDLTPRYADLRSAQKRWIRVQASVSTSSDEA